MSALLCLQYHCYTSIHLSTIHTANDAFWAAASRDNDGPNLLAGYPAPPWWDGSLLMWRYLRPSSSSAHFDLRMQFQSVHHDRLQLPLTCRALTPKHLPGSTSSKDKMVTYTRNISLRPQNQSAAVQNRDGPRLRMTCIALTLKCLPYSTSSKGNMVL